MNTLLRYRTFDELFDEATIDIKNIVFDNNINPHSLIKTVRRLNHDLGLRIFRVTETVIEVEKSRAELPEDFFSLNYAMVCGGYTWTEVLPQGTHIEEKLVPNYQCPQEPTLCTDPCNQTDPCNPCNDPCEPQTPTCPTSTCLTKCGDEYVLEQKIKTRTRTYKTFFPLRIKNTREVNCNCPNLRLYGAPNEARIEDNWLKTNFETGNVYLNYLADMVDEEGNLLVPDHALLNEYYEYALKEKILENMMYNGENIGDLLQYTQQKLRMARNNALSYVNTPNFEEMRRLNEVNRAAQYSKYYDMFKNYPANPKNLYSSNTNQMTGRGSGNYGPIYHG